MAKTTLEVSGMTCGHCVNSVTSALEALEHVEHVDVELHSGERSVVTVSHDSDASLGDFAGAITHAGYTLEAVTHQS